MKLAKADDTTSSKRPETQQELTRLHHGKMIRHGPYKN